MTYKRAWRPLLRIVLTSSVLLAACARSAIEEVEDASFSINDGGEEPEEDAGAPDEDEDAGEEPDMDASSPPPHDAGPPGQDAAPQDAGAMGSMDSAAAHPEAGPADSSTAADANMDAAPDAAPDAARDAAPVDATPPVDTAPPAPKCTAGNYRGKFMGTVIVEFIVPLFEIHLNGDISLSAVAEAGTDRFTVTNGTITGKDDDGNQVTAKVTGSLNCTTGKVENGRLAEGRYFRPILGEILFDGVVTGTYTNTPPSANGNWETQTASTDLLKSGMGTWNVSLAP